MIVYLNNKLELGIKEKKGIKDVIALFFVKFFAKKQTIASLIPFFSLIPNSNSLFLQKNI
jgi:hypothetical protein